MNVGAAETFRNADGGAPYWFQFERFLPADLGNPYLGFPDELWLDPHSANVRAVMYERFRYAKDAGCDGVEPDNVDAFTHDLPDADADDPGTGFSLTPEDQLDYNVYVANTAHSLGLSVLMKNDDLQVSSPTTGVYSLMDYFDGALVEECVQFGFCDAYDPFLAAGKPVFVAEYAGQLSRICPLRARGFSLIRKRPVLDAWLEACLPPPSPRVRRHADR